MFKAAERVKGMTPYTIGDFTVSALYTDTLITPKDISVPDLDFAVDFKKTNDGASEAVIANITSPDLLSHENIRYARQDVSDVYNGVVIDSSMKFPNRRGVQVLAEISTVYRAVNSVSGDEYDLPCKGRIVLRVPAASCVTKALVEDLLNRTISAGFNTGEEDETRVMEMIMGSLIPA